MALPHPHGIGDGQIGANALFDELNTPPPPSAPPPYLTGGRFIGFGEEGTSTIANRAHWALSENINYVYEKLAKEFAMPQLDYWVPAGGGGDRYPFSGEVWCGDASYQPWSQGRMDQLFSVLDENFNQLTDPVTQGKVCGVSIRSLTDNVYGTGFVTDPILRFQVVDPFNTDTVLLPSYVIPDDTKVYILSGYKTTLEFLPVDAFTKVPVRVGEEVPAGVILQDGTRPMTADLDLNSRNIINVRGLYSAVGADLSIRGAGGAENLWVTNWANIQIAATGTLHLHGDTLTEIRGADINFQDSRLSSPVYLTQIGTTAVQGVYPANLVGTLNSRWYNDCALHGNRVRSLAGSFTFDNGTRQVNWPDLDVILNGDRVSIAAGSIIAPDSASRALVVQFNGVVAQKVVSAVLSTDLIIAYYSYSGGTFRIKIDARWILNRRTGTLEVTVGSSSTPYTPSVGCDFYDLQAALDYVYAAKTIATSSGGNSNLACTVRVVGNLVVYSGVTVLTNGINLVGDGASFILAAHGAAESTINAANSRLNVRGITFYRFGNLLDTNRAAIANLGTDSIVEGCNCFGYFGNFLYWANATEASTLIKRVRVSDCYAEVAYGFARSGENLVDSLFTHCAVLRSAASGSSNMYAFDLPLPRNVIQFCHVMEAAGGYSGFAGGIRLGFGGQAIGNEVAVYGASPFKAITVEPMNSEIAVYATDTFSQAVVRGNVTKGGWVGVGCYVPSGYSSHVFHLKVEGNTIQTVSSGVWWDNTGVVINAASEFTISNNLISGISGLLSNAVFLKNTPHATIIGNRITNNLGMGIWLSDNAQAQIIGNKIDGYGENGVSISLPGVVGSFVRSGIYVEFTINGGYTFTNEDIGRCIGIAFASAGNNGVFQIKEWLTSTKVRYINTSGITEAGPFVVWWLGLTNPSAIWIGPTAAMGSEISNNIIGATGAPAYSSMLHLNTGRLRVRGNYLEGGAVAATGIYSKDTYDSVFAENCVAYTALFGMHLLCTSSIATVSVCNNVLYSPSNYGGAAIQIESGTHWTVSGNTVYGGSGNACGVALVSHYNYTTKPSCSSIMGNAFRGVKSGGPDSATVVLVQFNVMSVSVSGNTFNGCGYNTTYSSSSVIQASGQHCSITGNTIQELRTCTAGGSIAYAIVVYGHNTTIMGNAIQVDFDYVAALTLKVIQSTYASTKSVISGNIIEYSGTNSTTQLIAIDFDGNNFSVVANNIGDTWSPVHSSDYFIYAGSTSYGNCTITGNTGTGRIYYNGKLSVVSCNNAVGVIEVDGGLNSWNICISNRSTQVTSNYHLVGAGGYNFDTNNRSDF